MPGTLTGHVAIVDPADRELEASVTATGARTSRLTTAELNGLVHPAAHQPDALVIDLRGGRRLPEALTALKHQHPSTGVVIVASALDPALLLEAMRAGANEFVSEPVKPADLGAALARLLEGRRPATVGQVFAFLGAKGGVGTTTTAVNVATALAKAERGSTLLIDLHLAYGDSSVFMGAEPRFSVLDALENTHRFDEAFFRGLVTATKSGPDLLASSDRVLPHTTSTPDFRVVVDFATRLYKFVVLDVPRSDALALDALDAAASIVVVANQELATVRSASRMAGALRQRYGKERVRIVVSRFDKHSEITQADVERVIGAKVGHLVPSDYRLALQALNSGRPLALDNHSKLAASYRDLAFDLAGLAKDPGSKTDQTSIFGRLTGRG